MKELILELMKIFTPSSKEIHTPKTDKPKVVLLGDSIRKGYLAEVKAGCKELDIDIWSPVKSGGRTSLWTLRHFQDWVIDSQADIVHVNFGIHDISMHTKNNRIPLWLYKLFLRSFIRKIKKHDIKMIWATTTPLCSKLKQVERYNQEALKIVEQEHIPVNDLYSVIMKNDYLQCLNKDGCHMTEFGNKVLADAVIKSIRALLREENV